MLHIACLWMPRYTKVICRGIIYILFQRGTGFVEIYPTHIFYIYNITELIKQTRKSFFFPKLNEHAVLRGK